MYFVHILRVCIRLVRRRTRRFRRAGQWLLFGRCPRILGVPRSSGSRQWQLSPEAPARHVVFNCSTLISSARSRQHCPGRLTPTASSSHHGVVRSVARRTGRRRAAPSHCDRRPFLPPVHPPAPSPPSGLYSLLHLSPSFPSLRRRPAAPRWKNLLLRRGYVRSEFLRPTTCGRPGPSFPL